jgi:predicted metal-dependent peptidase
MQKARGDLIQAYPFFGLLALSLELKETNDPDIPIMATDGRHLYYRPDIVKDTPQVFALGIVAHEVLHCALQHLFRRNHRNPEKWNRATDYAVNAIVLKERLSLPPSRLFNTKYADMSAEEIYTKIPNDPPPDGGGVGQIGWNFGTCLDPSIPTKDNPKPVSQAEIDSRAQEWGIRTKQAAHAAKQAGRLPGSLEHLVNEFLKPQIPWRQQLWHFFSKSKPGRISWNRPNRRLLSISDTLGNLIRVCLPSRTTVPTGDIIIAFDTSGSISPAARVQFASEINEIHKTLEPEKTTVLYIDTTVQDVVEFASYDEIKIEDPGGGGTSFQPAFDWVRNEKPEMDALVYLTDGYPDRWPEQAPDYPVLWVITNDLVKPPWGEHIVLEIEDE